jgi:UDP-N-acetylglucosamine 2-epimerase (non-hydrolysing)
MERANLQQEHINLEHVFITGNPVIDALHWIIANKPSNTHLNLENIVIVTSHRRENFGEKLTQICLSILQLTQKYPHLNFVIPVHPNPHVQQEIHKLLSHNAAIHLLPPLAYNDFIHLMNICLLILTDSGGVQEEAPALGKPVVVLRNITERPAIIEQGLGVLAGTDSQEIIRVVSNILEDQSLYSHMARGVSPYGDGHAAEKIVAVLHDYFHSSE